jgi:hypothetical protein
MSRGEEKLSVTTPNEDALKAYRRLIELQKQMIELSQQHEQARRACDTLRQEVARNWTARSRTKLSFRPRAQWSVTKFLKRLPGFGSNPASLNGVKHKAVSSC